MRKLGLFLSLTLFALSAMAVSYRQLAKEMEPLLAKMDRHDPARLVMVLRLADVLFETAVEVNKSNQIDNKTLSEVERNQKKAVELYELAMTGLNGDVAKPDLGSQYRIEFQLARLYTDLGKLEIADQKWNKLTKQNLDKRIQMESALRLSEKLELSTNSATLQKAGELYDLALRTCNKASLCSYIEYRRGWVYYRLGQNNEALESIVRSLAKADRAMVDEVLKDTILFISHADWSAEKAIAFLEKATIDHKKPKMIEQLASAYFTSDKREHFYQVSLYLLKKDPHLDQYISLADFEYAQGRMTDMQKTLNGLESAVARNLAFTSPEKQIESEKTFFRLIFQWDGERKTRPEVFTSLTGQGAMLYTKIFPVGPQLEKVMDGWVAVQDKAEVKLKQVEIWRAMQEPLATQKKIVAHLDDLILSLSLELKDWNRVLAVSDRIQRANPKAPRAVVYQKAKALYELKRTEEALPILKSLAAVDGAAPDQYAIYSQNLALDILAQQNRFDEIQSQASTWTKNSKLLAAVGSDKKLTGEINDMKSIADKAAFSKAVTSKDKDSLKTFKEFCFANKLTPKSCENAKAIAVQIKDHASLIEILRFQRADEELANELEFSGFFSESAAVREKIASKSAFKATEQLRIALLFEIGGAMSDRNRVLQHLSSQFAKNKSSLSEGEEKLLFQALMDASLMNADSLKLPWRSDNRMELAAHIEDTGHGNAESKKMLIESCQKVGNTWRSLQFARLKDKSDRQAKMSIVGRQSQKNFNKRVEVLRQMGEDAQCFLKGESDPELRLLVMSSMAKSYGDFAAEIKSVPVPEGLDEQTLKDVQGQIAQMAAPFEELKAGWVKNSKTALEALPILEREKAERKYLAGSLRFDYKAEAQAGGKKISYNWEPLLKELKGNPENRESLKKLKEHFEGDGQSRLALYFAGRLNSRGLE